MSGNWDDVDFDSSYDFDSWVYVEYETYANFESYVDVSHDFCIDVNIDGDSAVFAIDVQAYGDHDSTATELNLAVFVEEGYSSIVATGYALVE